MGVSRGVDLRRLVRCPWVVHAVRHTSVTTPLSMGMSMENIHHEVAAFVADREPFLCTARPTLTKDLSRRCVFFHAASLDFCGRRVPLVPPRQPSRHWDASVGT